MSAFLALFENNAPGLGTTLERAQGRFMQGLSRLGITDKPAIKVKAFTGARREWLASYRSRTQFGGKPIFWINDGFLTITQ